jgi:hypothetical protein
MISPFQEIIVYGLSFSLQKYLKQDNEVRNIMKLCETTPAQACLDFATKNRRNSVFFNRGL